MIVKTIILDALLNKNMSMLTEALVTSSFCPKQRGRILPPIEA